MPVTSLAISALGFTRLLWSLFRPESSAVLFLHTSKTCFALLIVWGFRFRVKPPEGPFQDLKDLHKSEASSLHHPHFSSLLLELFLFCDAVLHYTSLAVMLFSLQVTDLPSMTQVVGDPADTVSSGIVENSGFDHCMKGQLGPTGQNIHRLLDLSSHAEDWQPAILWSQDTGWPYRKKEIFTTLVHHRPLVSGRIWLDNGSLFMMKRSWWNREMANVGHCALVGSRRETKGTCSFLGHPSALFCYGISSPALCSNCAPKSVMWRCKIYTLSKVGGAGTSSCPGPKQYFY